MNLPVDKRSNRRAGATANSAAGGQGRAAARGTAARRPAYCAGFG